MKKILIEIITLTVIVSCNNKAKLDANKEIVSLKDSLQMYKNSFATDTAAGLTTNAAIVKTKPVTTVTTVRTVNRPVATTTVTRKKGWSKAAKGTAIGAGAGALTGVLISKNKGKGALIGGLLGAGAGYVVGRSNDKKDGRVKRKH